MSLEKYNKKRNFEQTEEPEGIPGHSDNQLIFVVQKHQASHLHYDFRLEMDGVLKSWAIPKGPSLDPNVKRLAVFVEDHPYQYKDFEGAIPKGNYGAGNVIIWDKGTYNSGEEKSLKDDEALLLAGLKKGHIKFTLQGEKLKGDFSLMKLKGTEDRNWLLVKKEDKYATSEDVLTNNLSVVSGLTLNKLSENSSVNRAAKDVQEKNEAISIDDPVFQSPMLATTSKKAFDDNEWLFEKKYDGYRIVTVINKKGISLYSRNEKLYTNDFKLIAEDLLKIDHEVVIDGEVVVEDVNGKSSFQMLQNYIKNGEGDLKYYVFDILTLDGKDVTHLKLVERKELLLLLVKNAELSNTFFSKHLVGTGILLFEESKVLEEEGIMAKKMDSLYHSGRRSNDWLKIKNHLQAEAVIIGITESDNNRNYFGALLLGQFEDEKLKFIGKCGSGFTEATLKDLYQLFKPYFTDKTCVENDLKIREKIQWLEPKFVCTVKFTEWTNSHHLRHPVFVGLRPDKDLNDLLQDDLIEINDKVQYGSETLTVNIGNQKLKLSNLNKIYFPEDNLSKGEIIHYYSEVAALILPYLKDRPQSLNRFPNGINNSSFYQKDFDTERMPEWLRTEKIYSDSNSKEIDYLVCNDKETLIYMVNLGCIDFNPWNSRIQNLNKPDWMVIDIDPSTNNFEEVIQTALMVRTVLDKFEIISYCKTSGASGIHVYVPLGGLYDYDSVKSFANLVAREVQINLPEITTLERSIKKRNFKIYIDYLQNRAGQTIAAPYSLRPVKGATISTPLEWDEVHLKMRPSDFTVKNALKRFNTVGDIWKPVLGPGIDLLKVISNYEN